MSKKLICIFCGLFVAMVRTNEVVLDNLDLKGPSYVTEGDNVTFECTSNYFRVGEIFHWVHVTFENKSSVLRANETLNITNNCEQELLNCSSLLTIFNISKQFDGSINCSHIYGNSIFSSKRKSKILPLKVEHAQTPMIYNASSANTSKIAGQSVQWWCNVQGMPPPSIAWFKNDEPLFLSQNDTRVHLLDNNQSLLIYSSELQDIGTYECRASNRLGTVVSVNTLNLTDEISANQESHDSIAFWSVVTISLAVIVIFFYKYLKIRRESKKINIHTGSLHMNNGFVETWNPDLAIGEQTELLPLDERWEFPRDKLMLGKQLGSGAFGVVFKAEAIDIVDKGTTTTVAVKMVKPNTDALYTKALASELKIMMHVGQHLNVVNLLGACSASNINRQLMVIVEYCQFGSIHQYLLNHRDCFVDQVTNDGNLDTNIHKIVPYYRNINYESSLSENTESQIDAQGYLVADNVGPMWRSDYYGDYTHMTTKPLSTSDLLHWSYQISKGMEYLAGKKILHGDLATRNILLSDDNIVKICDFGFAKTLYESENYKKKSKKDRLPVKWMAIESLRDLVFSTQSDVWAFGIVIWEIFSLAVTPYPNIRTYDELYNKLIKGYRMEKPNYANSNIYKIMLDCWKSDPALRPTFSDLAGRLDDLFQHSSRSSIVRLNEIYLTMDAKRPHSDEHVDSLTTSDYLQDCSTFTDIDLTDSHQNSGSESSVLINDLKSELIVYNSSYDVFK